MDFTHITTGSAWCGLFLLGTSLWFVLHLILAGDRSGPDHFVSFALKTAAILLVMTGTLAMAFAIGGSLIAVPAGFLMLVIAAMMTNRLRLGETRALMWQLGVASRKGVPVIDAARAFAAERTDELGHRVMVMVDSLEKGATLEAAVKSARLPVNADLALAVRSGLGKMTLPEVAVGSLWGRRFGPIDLTGVLHQFLYLATVCGIGATTWSFSYIKVLPTYRQIMADFEIAPPAVTQIFMNVSANNFFLYLCLALFWILVVTVLLAIPALIYYIGWMRWEPPILRRLSSRYHGAIILRGLAVSIERNQTLADAIPQLAIAYPTTYVRDRLVTVADEVTDGGDWIDALRSQNLINDSAAGVLHSAEKVGNLPWALREMSGSLIRLLTFRIKSVMQMVSVAIILLVSLPVGFFAIALFAPLPEMIMSML